MKNLWKMTLLICLLALGTSALVAHAQTPWSNFIDSSRAIDWTQNVGFTIPSYTVACATQPTGLTAGSGAASANATIINNAIASCTTGHNVINIPAGTWYLTYIEAQQSKVVIRGAGPLLTEIIPTTGTGCAGGITAGICFFEPNDVSNQSPAVLPPSGTQQCLWTGGLTQGSTTINLTSCGGAPVVDDLIILDQANDTTDTNGVYICDANTTGCAVDGPGGGNNNGRNYSGITHSEQQVTQILSVTSLGGGSYAVTIPAPGVYNTNIRSGQSPGAWWFQALTNVGVEDLTIDGTTMSSSDPTDFGNIGMLQCNQCWIRNVRSLNAGRYHAEPFISYRCVIRDSYFYGALNPTSSSYAVEFETTSGDLVENNIMQQVVAPVMSGMTSGSVIGYNYTVDNVYSPTTFLNPSSAAHNAGNNFNLWESNSMNGIWADDTWGSSDQNTLFRNMVIGWQSGRTNATVPHIFRSFIRNFNLVGNILGHAGYHTQYQTYATSTTGGTGGGAENTSIYSLGWGGTGPACSVGGVTLCDPLTFSTLMRWGNYDTVNAATQWNATEAAPVAVPYVNANFTTSYFSSLAHILPASLYYSSTPSWWPSGKAWPLVGPDITSGNIGTCTGTYAGAQATSSSQCTGGTLATAWASHVTSTPAQDCYLNVLGGPPDGSGSALNFDANTCYASSPSNPPGDMISPGVNIQGVVVQ